MVGLLQRLVSDLKRLITQQLCLAVHEMQLELHCLAKVTILSILLILIVPTALVVTSLALAATLHEVAGWPMWASYGSVSLLLIVTAVILTLVIKNQVGQLHFLPIQTLHILKEDTQWMKEQLGSLKT